ncbi:MAG: hypothetical protein WCB27_08540 [Thermoguttaceae bacterium]
MTTRPHTPQLAERIRDALALLPIPSEQRARVVSKLLKYASFIDTCGGKRPPGNFSATSTVFDFTGKLDELAGLLADTGQTRDDWLRAAIRNPSLFMQSPSTVAANILGLVAEFAVEGITLQLYMRAAMKHPAVLCQSPTTVGTNIRGVVKRFTGEGMTVRAYLRAALKQPSLFHYPRRAVAANIEGTVKRFASEGLTLRSYVACALKQPSLFHQSPKGIAANVKAVVKRFADTGLSTADYVSAATRHPSLFYQSPDTIVRNIRGLVAEFAAEGITVRAYLDAALRQPPLFSLAPATIVGNIVGVATQFSAVGMTVAEYLGAALKQPPLFYQKPDTVARHIRLILQMYDDGILALPRPRRGRKEPSRAAHNHAAVVSFLLANPVVLARNDSNLALCRTCVELGVVPAEECVLLKPRGQLEERLLKHFGHDDPTCPVGENASPVLRQLISDGYIKSARLAL